MTKKLFKAALVLAVLLASASVMAAEDAGPRTRTIAPEEGVGGAFGKLVARAWSAAMDLFVSDATEGVGGARMTPPTRVLSVETDRAVGSSGDAPSRKGVGHQDIEGVGHQD